MKLKMFTMLSILCLLTQSFYAVSAKGYDPFDAALSNSRFRSSVASDFRDKTERKMTFISLVCAKSVSIENDDYGGNRYFRMKINQSLYAERSGATENVLISKHEKNRLSNAAAQNVQVNLYFNVDGTVAVSPVDVGCE